MCVWVYLYINIIFDFAQGSETKLKNLYDVTIFGVQWIICMYIPQVGHFSPHKLVIFLCFKRNYTWTKNAFDDFTSPSRFVLFF